jgi:uncharacterized SAM-binding protein YcdF (DUF218 family)
MKWTLLIIGLLVIVSLFGWGLYLTDASLLNSNELRSFLMNRLVKEVPAIELLNEPSHDSNGIIYVLAGSQRDLEGRLKKAVALYRDGAAGKVVIMSRPGLTGYSSQLGRNLTNDEWAINQLIDLGMQKADIEVVSIPWSFFGTYHEAKAISDITLKKGYRYLLLVSSPYHTKRVWNSFSKMLQGRNVSLYVYASADPVEFNALVIEYFKLLTYDNLLLPLFRSPASSS